jgi:hypothetical protein
MNYTISPLTYAVHIVNDSPVFGESSTHVTYSDEAGGGFITITQCHDVIKPGEIRVSLEELGLIVRAATDLMKANVTIEDLI